MSNVSVFWGLLLLLMSLGSGKTVAAFDSSIPLAFEIAEEVWIKEPGNIRPVKYKPLVLYSAGGAYHGIKGVSISRRQKWVSPDGWQDDQKWDLALLTDPNVSAQSCFYLRGISVARLPAVMRIVRLFEYLNLDAIQLKFPILQISRHLEELDKTQWSNVSQEGGREPHFKLGLADKSKNDIRRYFQRAFKNEQLSCYEATGEPGFVARVQAVETAYAKIKSENEQGQSGDIKKKEEMLLTLQGDILQAKAQLKNLKADIEAENNSLSDINGHIEQKTVKIAQLTKEEMAAKQQLKKIQQQIVQSKNELQNLEQPLSQTSSAMSEIEMWVQWLLQSMIIVLILVAIKTILISRKQHSNEIGETLLEVRNSSKTPIEAHYEQHVYDNDPQPQSIEGEVNESNLESSNQELSLQLNKEQSTVLLLEQQNDQLTKEKLAISQECKDIKNQIEPTKKALFKRHKILLSILAGFGYVSNDKQPAAVSLLLNDMSNRAEQLSCGLALTNLQHFLTTSGRLDTPLYTISRLDQLQKLLADTSYLTFFKDGAPPLRIKGRWKGQFSLIFRAGLLFKTYWPMQETKLQILLSDCILAIEHLLNKRGIYPHNLQLVKHTQLLEGAIEHCVESPIGSDLAQQKNFMEAIKPLAEQGLVYCDVAIWGYEQLAEDGTKEVVIQSKLVGLNQDFEW